MVWMVDEIEPESKKVSKGFGVMRHILTSGMQLDDTRGSAARSCED